MFCGDDTTADGAAIAATYGDASGYVLHFPSATHEVIDTESGASVFSGSREDCHAEALIRDRRNVGKWFIVVPLGDGNGNAPQTFASLSDAMQHLDDSGHCGDFDISRRGLRYIVTMR